MPQRRLSAILALDVVGYSRMMHENASSTLSSLNAVYRGLLKPAVAANQGRIVKLLGDGALIEFSSAAQALACAVNVQRELRKPDCTYRDTKPIMLRAGLHAGDVTVEDSDIFGDGVNIACRLQDAAEAGGILASRLFCDLAGADTGVRMRGEGMHSFKGVGVPIEVLSVDLTDPDLESHRDAILGKQEIRFFKAKDGVRLAWTINGSGPPLVKAPNWVSHLELDRNKPSAVTDSLSDRYQIIRFDARGNGLSDWDVDDISFDRFVDDIESLFDAAGIERSAIIGLSQGAAFATAFASRNPERVSCMVILGGRAVGAAFAKSENDRKAAKAFRELMQAGWDDDDEYPSLRDLIVQKVFPTASEEQRRQFAEEMRQMISPKNMRRFREVVDHMDVRPFLPSVNIPALVCHCADDRMVPVEQARVYAAGLPNARLVTYDSSNHIVPTSDPVWPQMERDILAFLADHA